MISCQGLERVHRMFLGRYIKVKDDKWIYTIESNLGIGFLSSFFVNNNDDRRLMYSLMDQVIRSGSKPTIHCSKFQEQVRHNIDDMLFYVRAKAI